MRISRILVLMLLAGAVLRAHAINFAWEDGGNRRSEAPAPFSEADARSDVSEAWTYFKNHYRIDPELFPVLEAQVQRFLTYVKTEEETRFYTQLLMAQVVHRQALSVDTLLDVLKSPSFLLTMPLLDFMGNHQWSFRVPEHGASLANRQYRERLDAIQPRSLEAALRHYQSLIRRISDPVVQLAIANASTQLPETAELYPLYGFLLEAGALAQTNHYTSEAFRFLVSEGMLMNNKNFMMPAAHVFHARGLSGHQHYGIFHLLPLLKQVRSVKQLKFFAALLDFSDARHPQNMSRLDRFNDFDIAIFRAAANILPHVNDRTNVEGLVAALWATERASDVANLYAFAKGADPERFPMLKRCWNLLRSFGKAEKFQTPAAL